MAKLSFLLCIKQWSKKALKAFFTAGLLFSLGLKGTENTPLPPSLAHLYTARRWTLDDGLPDSQICGVATDQAGCLWLATPRFLVRFDGTVFTPMDVPAQSMHGHNEGLFIDSADGVWIYGKTGAYRYHNSTGWQNGDRVVPQGRVTGIAECAGGVLYIAHKEGLYVYQNGVATMVLAASVFFADGRGVIRSVACADQNTLLIDTGAAIYSWSRGLGAPPVLQVSKQSLNLLPKALNKQPLAYGDSRCLRFIAGRWESLPEIRPVRPRSFLDMPDGSLWLGHDAGIDVFDGTAWQTQTQSVLYGPASVLAMAADPENNIWVATTEGLIRLRRRLLHGVQLSGSSAIAKVSVLWVENDHQVLAGLLTGGLATGDAAGLEPLLVPPDFADVALNALYREKNGKIWCGGSGGSLWTLQNQSLQRIEGVYADGVRSILGKGDAPTWVATRRGMLMLNPERNRLVEMAWPMDPVLALWLDTDNTLWVAHESRGLAVLNTDNSIGAPFPEPMLPGRTIRTLYRDREGILWVGGIFGLARLDGDSHFVFRKAHGLWDESIRQVSEDNDGFLWLGSTEGVMRVSKRALSDVAKGTKKYLPVRVFGREAGMENEACSGGVFFPFGEPPTKRLWFPTAAGLLTVDTKSLPALRPPPSIHISSIEAGSYLKLSRSQDDHYLPMPKTADNPRDIRIEYTALEFATPERTRFEHKLTGPVTQESGLTKERLVMFSRLPPGNYTFTLNACNGDGVWNTRGTVISWTVKPFFWETGTFRLFALMLSGSLLVIAVRTNERKRAYRKIEAAERAQSLERERARIARDLHDEIGAKLTRLSLLGNMVSEEAQHNEALRRQVEEMAESARETHRAFDEIVWSVSPRNDTVKSLSHYICKYAEDFFANTPVACTYDLPDAMRDCPIDPQCRHHFFLAVKECLNNILKHSGATQAGIVVNQCDRRLVVEVSDNGCGFDPQKTANHGNGLLNMRERMRILGGSLQIVSRTGEGAVLVFTAPV